MDKLSRKIMDAIASGEVTVTKCPEGSAVKPERSYAAVSQEETTTEEERMLSKTAKKNLDELISVNDSIETLHNTRSESLDEHRKQLTKLFNEAIHLRERIDSETPEAWEEAPKPFTVPNQPLKWFQKAAQSIASRNARRKLIQARAKEIHSLLKQHTDAVQINRLKQQMDKLVSEAWELGDFEPDQRGDNTATNYVKLLAWSMRDHAEAEAGRQEACIKCGNLAQPNAIVCHDCGTLDIEAAQELKNREEAILEREALREQGEEPESELLPHILADSFQFDA